MDGKGTLYFFTGLSGAGKTTIGGEFYRRLKARNNAAVLLDGDQTRPVYNEDSSYSAEDRLRGALRTFRVCKMLTDQGIDVVCCSISMFDEARRWNRENIENYREIYVRASMETLFRRDQKGIYSRNDANVMGVNLDFEEPKSPDIVIDNDGAQTPSEIVTNLERQLFPRPQPEGGTRYAIVTGSTKGIGRAIGEALLKRGCRVGFNYAADGQSAEVLSAHLDGAGFGGRYKIVRADLSRYEGIEALLSGLGPEFQALDYLVLNAGTTARGSLETLAPDAWERVLRTNLTVPLFLAQSCAARMRPGGCILFTGSALGKYPHALSIPYSVTKAGVHHLTRCLVKEFEPKRVRVNCVVPGFVETPWQKDKPAEIRASIERKIALHRFAKPEEVARIACDTLENSYMNGALVPVDGGYCYQ